MANAKRLGPPSKNFSEGSQKSLGLDEATTKKVFNAHLANTKLMDAIRMGQGSEKGKKMLWQLTRKNSIKL